MLRLQRIFPVSVVNVWVSAYKQSFQNLSSWLTYLYPHMLPTFVSLPRQGTKMFCFRVLYCIDNFKHIFLKFTSLLSFYIIELLDIGEYCVIGHE